MTDFFDKRQFRLLDANPQNAARHMTLDKVILEAHSQGNIPNTFRFLEFETNCALLGLHQNAYLEIDVSYCKAAGIEINRRITGGGTLYWPRFGLGWEIYAYKDTPEIPKKIEDIYYALCEIMAQSLVALGIKAAYRPVNDIEIDGRKICGTAGAQIGGSFVFQCSLLVDFEAEEMLKVLKVPQEKLSDKKVNSISQRLTSVKNELGCLPHVREIKTAILNSFEKKLGYKFNLGELTLYEKELFENELPVIMSDKWIYGQNSRLINTVDTVYSYKTPGGLIRLQMRLDDKINFIKYVIITGDFLAYPARAVNDIETALKNIPIKKERISAVIDDFFTKNRVEMPGITAAHFKAAILAALDEAIKNKHTNTTEKTNAFAPIS